MESPHTREHHAAKDDSSVVSAESVQAEALYTSGQEEPDLNNPQLDAEANQSDERVEDEDWSQLSLPEFERRFQQEYQFKEAEFLEDLYTDGPYDEVITEAVRIADTMTAETLPAMLVNYLELSLKCWSESDCCKSLEARIEQHLPEGWQFRRGVLLGLGAITEFERPYHEDQDGCVSTITQLAIFMWIARKVYEKTGARPELFAQDPHFNAADQAALEACGITVTKAPNAENLIDRDTFVLGIGFWSGELEGAPFEAQAALLVGGGLDDDEVAEVDRRLEALVSRNVHVGFYDAPHEDVPMPPNQPSAEEKAEWLQMMSSGARERFLKYEVYLRNGRRSNSLPSWWHDYRSPRIRIGQAEGTRTVPQLRKLRERLLEAKETYEALPLVLEDDNLFSDNTGLGAHFQLYDIGVHVRKTPSRIEGDELASGHLLAGQMVVLTTLFASLAALGAAVAMSRR